MMSEAAKEEKKIESVEKKLDKQPEKQFKMQIPTYSTGRDLTPVEVNQMLDLGYTLHSVVPVVEQVTKNGIVITYATQLTYHFIRR